MSRKIRALVLIFCACSLWAGCAGDGGNEKHEQPITIPPHIAGTVHEYALLVGGGGMPVTGWGLAVGLGNDGSKVVPAHVRSYLVEQLSIANIGSARHGTGELSPRQVLQDRDTAAVMLAGLIPFGAPVGARFDVNVSALPQTGTRSLDGGHLMPTEMRFAYGGQVLPGRGAKVFAKARGRLFVNPYIDLSNPLEAAKLREARIIGGGVVTENRPIRLQLREADFHMAQIIRDRINERFGARDKIANARNREMLELTVPRKWRRDHEHFLQLVMHLPLLSGPDQREQKTRQLVRMMELPGARHDQLALILEAMGRQVEPRLRGLYGSRNPSAAFYAARTGLRLGDRDLAGEVLVRAAGTSGSPLQIPAIEELARHPEVLLASDTLLRLLDDSSATVRVAAYEALRKRGEQSRITRISVGGQFEIDLVASKRSPVIYATQSIEPRIVIFGKDVSVGRPVFFTTADELVTVNARRNQKRLTVYRRIPRTGKSSDPFEVDFKVHSLISTLGLPPDRDEAGKIMGLGLAYGQVVRVLHQMCEAGHIRAKLVLQRPPALRKGYRGTTAVGRPDIPG